MMRIDTSPEAQIVWNLLDISVLLNRYGDHISRQAGITTQQWLLLLHLAADPNIPFLRREQHTKPLTASELATALSVSRPNVTNLLGGLIAKGLVRQTEDPDDRRKKRLALTPRGRELLLSLEPGRQRFNQKLLGDLPAHQVGELLAQLRRLNRTIREDFGD